MPRPIKHSPSQQKHTGWNHVWILSGSTLILFWEFCSHLWDRDVQLWWSSTLGAALLWRCHRLSAAVSQLHLPGEISCSVFKAGRLELMQLQPREDITQRCEWNLNIKLYKLSVFWDSRSENGIRRSGGDWLNLDYSSTMARETINGLVNFQGDLSWGSACPWHAWAVAKENVSLLMLQFSKGGKYYQWLSV